MSQTLRIRLLDTPDLPFAHELRERIGWNQTRRDWQRMLEYEPSGCFLAEWEGTPAGTATTSRYGLAAAWIGMVLVHPEFQRRGIGKALLQRCLDYLRGCQVRTIKLDATPMGQPLYEQLGFRADWTLHRWFRPGTRRDDRAANRPQHFELPDSLQLLDERAFGVHRWRMITALANDSSMAAIQRDASGQAIGYGLLRPGAHTQYLGPVVAGSADAGVSIVRQLLATAGDELVHWDIPAGNSAAVELARELGFAPQRPLIRMYLGDAACSGNPGQQFAIADPAIG